jgi:predicted Co/Zn/Cd cation transporter (cation efflux family)
MRVRIALGLALVALLLVPATAFASTGVLPAEGLEFDMPGTLSTITGVLTLLLAVVLLVVTLQLRRVADGSAIAGNITYVMAGSACLATSVLLGFLERFIASWVSSDVVRAAADMLIFMAMLFLALYFNAVRQALNNFLQALSLDELPEPEPDVELTKANGSAQEDGGTAADA